MMRRGDVSLVFFTVLSQWSVGIVICLFLLNVSGGAPSSAINTGPSPANPLRLALLLIVAAPDLGSAALLAVAGALLAQGGWPRGDALGGILLVQAFDGDITLRNLRISDPLGLVPRLWADARIEHLDLKTLTRAFSFGRIEGRLQGRVDGLYMEAWQLVAFDAHFETPPDDDSRHRISQRAVENISDLGGAGISGALSRSFLRGFKEFGYKRLGISCRLHQGICEMGGVAPAGDGYYLVEGAGIPRIDIVGFNRRTDWQRLLSQLRQMVSGDVSPVVQ